MSDSRSGVTRAARTARGALSAAAATLLASVSHALAGGVITPLAVAATAMLALPLCVALSGRLGSLWRMSLAVGASQFVYHWSFWGLGASAGTPSGTPVRSHAAHLSTFFSPGVAASGAAEWWMWASHAAAALLTIALLHRGELAAIAIARLIGRALPLRLPRAIEMPAGPKPVSAPPAARRVALLAVLTSISHRGPPALPSLLTI